jgi:hypothetical protein
MKFIERNKHALDSKWLGKTKQEIVDWYDGPLSAFVEDEFGDKFFALYMEESKTNEGRFDLWRIYYIPEINMLDVKDYWFTYVKAHITKHHKTADEIVEGYDEFMDRQGFDYFEIMVI